MHDHIPKDTLRDLAAVLVVTTELAWNGTKHVLRKLKPLVEPPDDLEVRSIVGAEYTGLVVIEENQILGGIVVRVGTGTGSGTSSSGPSSPPPRYERREPLFTPPSPTRDPYLRGWSDDPREEEERPWLYR